MKSEKEITEKMQEMSEKATEAVIDSHKDQEMTAVNRGAIYGWHEALRWVLTDEVKTISKEEGEASE